MSIPIKQTSIDGFRQNIPASNSGITIQSFDNISFTGLYWTSA